MLARAFAIALAASFGSGCATTPEPGPSSTQQANRTAALRAIFGPPSQLGFGSAVFAERVDQPQDLEAVAKRCYRHFLGKKWAAAGESVWMAPWQRVYTRPSNLRPAILAELHSIQNPAVRSSISMLLDGHDTPEAARQALSTVYDDAAMETVEVYTLGDGAALSGVLIVGRTRSGAATLLAFLMD